MRKGTNPIDESLFQQVQKYFPLSNSSILSLDYQYTVLSPVLNIKTDGD